MWNGLYNYKCDLKVMAPLYAESRIATGAYD